MHVLSQEYWLMVYTLVSDAVSSIARHRIKKAMIHWQRHTCIKFVEYNPLKHRNYVRIQKGQWCASKLGMAGGVQPLYIALGCLVSAIAHTKVQHQKLCAMLFTALNAPDKVFRW